LRILKSYVNREGVFEAWANDVLLNWLIFKAKTNRVQNRSCFTKIQTWLDFDFCNLKTLIR